MTGNPTVTDKDILDVIELLEESSVERCSKLFRFTTTPYYRDISFVLEGTGDKQQVKILVEGLYRTTCKSKGELIDAMRGMDGREF